MISARRRKNTVRESKMEMERDTCKRLKHFKQRGDHLVQETVIIFCNELQFFVLKRSIFEANFVEI